MNLEILKLCHLSGQKKVVWDRRIGGVLGDASLQSHLELLGEAQLQMCFEPCICWAYSPGV